MKSLKEDSFSLSSGDFPTLGSEKDNSVKIVESEGDCITSNDCLGFFIINAPHSILSSDSSCCWTFFCVHLSCQDDIFGS